MITYDEYIEENIFITKNNSIYLSDEHLNNLIKLLNKLI